MAITINYITNEILVPKADTTFVETDPISGREIRSLDMNDFRNALADLQDNQLDVWAPTAFINTAPQDLGSITLGRSVVILAPYFVTFEAGTYAVQLIGGNSNIASRTTINGVTLIPNNSAGLIQVTSGSGVLPGDVTAISAAVWNKLAADHLAVGSMGKLMDIMQLMLDEMHKIQGLDISNPMVVTPTARTAGTIDLDITGDGETITTVTRQ